MLQDDFDEEFHQESPFEDDDHITFVTGDDAADAVSRITDGLPPELLAEAKRKGKEVSEKTSLLNSTDCERCHMMGAVGVQVAFAKDVLTNEVHDTEGDLAVVKLCGPCTMLISSHAHSEYQDAKRNISRRN